MKKFISSAFIAAVASMTLSGCSFSLFNKLEIELEEGIPSAVVGEEFDFEECIVAEKGTKYSIECYYQDYYQGIEKKLEVDGLTFTPVENFDISVIITAKKGIFKGIRTTTVDVVTLGDDIDELLKTGGWSGWSDDGFVKTISQEPSYLHSENSKSSLNCAYSGNNSWTWGGAVLCMNNFRLLPKWADKTWENGVFSFYVYNPNDVDLEFQMRITDKTGSGLNIDWSHELTPRWIAKPNEWTHCYMSLRKVNVTHPLFVNEEGTRNDSFTLKVRKTDIPKTADVPVYNFQLYLDDIDVIPYEMCSEAEFPGLDTTPNELPADGLENLSIDVGWSRATISYDKTLTYGEKSTTSLKLTYENTTDFYQPNVAFFTDEEYMNFRDFTHGNLKADIHLSDNITYKVVTICACQDWESGVKWVNNIPLTELGGGWYKLDFDLSSTVEFTEINKTIRLGFKFPGVDEPNKATAQVNIDNIEVVY